MSRPAASFPLSSHPRLAVIWVRVQRGAITGTVGHFLV
jgi:hypothetical protein